jgi:TorA maturation chaperone TorD
MLHLARLDGDPIPDTDYIRNHLRGWSPEFIELCCKQFRKGELVAFDVVWRGDE